MIPLRVTCQSFRCLQSLEWEIPDGATALIGVNGVGKSSRLLAIEFALFGSRSRSSVPYLRRGDTELSVSLEFEHGSDTYRVRRGYSARGAGKTWLTFDKWVDAISWIPLTKETASETQTAISELLELSRRTYRASAYSPQRVPGEPEDDWACADPAERKSILGEVLALDDWDDLLAEAKRRRVAVERDLTKARAESDPDAVVRVLEAESRLADAERLSDALGEQEAGLAEALPDLQRVAQEMHTAAAQAGVIVQAAKDARARRDEAVEKRDTLIGRIDEAHDKLSGIDEASETASHLADHERALAELVDDNARVRSANAEAIGAHEDRRRAAREAREAWERAAAAHAEAAREMEQASARYEQASGPASECPTCHQELAGDARRLTVTRLQDERRELMAKVDVLRKQKVELVKTLEIADEAAKVEAMILDLLDATQITGLITVAREAAQRVAAAEGWRSQLQNMERELEQVTQAVSRLEVEFAETDAAAMAVHDVDARLRAAESALEDATTRDAEIRRKRRDAASDVATRTAELAQARTRAESAEAADARAGGLEQSLNDLLLLERGYGRDGVPALIVETVALPAIQAEANRVLDDLASPFRVDLRAQRQTKSGETREALDIIIHTPTGEALFETLSGGEATRVNVALRIGLARLLASRRGADVGVFAIDEPDGLDQDGADRLAVILKELARTTFRSVILVSHQNGLRDALDNVIELTGEDVRDEQAVAA